MTFAVHHGDSRDVLKTLADASIDSVVTDPPYALVSIGKRFGADDAAPQKFGKDGAYARATAGFMGQKWDTGETAFDPAFWFEVLRVLKPGGHLIAFGGTRTYHRLAVAIEDAGFEIRDQLGFLYGSGFPKSHNIGKQLDKNDARCNCDKDMRDMRPELGAKEPGSKVEPDLRPQLQGRADRAQQQRPDHETTQDVPNLRRDSQGSTAVETEETGHGQRVLQPEVLGENEISTHAGYFSAGGGSRYAGGQRQESNEGRAESSMEGRGDASSSPGQLCERSVSALSRSPQGDGEVGWIHNGTPPSHGGVDWPSATTDGGRSSHGSQSAEQPQIESRALAGQSQPQAGGAWPICRGCGKPIVRDGIGTALKPAWEPIVLARKPLIGTVAANVLAHGTGAINVDGCRVPSDDDLRAGAGILPMRHHPEIPRGRVGEPSHDRRYSERGGTDFAALPGPRGGDQKGRFPANIIHDGSDEVLDAFPSGSSQRATVTSKPGAVFGNGAGLPSHTGQYGFNDNGSAARFFYSAKADKKDRLGSKHPTVKPVDLMAYLCRLITPPGGTVLDPFAGSGSTGMACLREGFDAVLIEREEQFVADIKRRIAHVSGEDAPLFAGTPSDTPPSHTRADGSTEYSRTKNRADRNEEVA